MANPTAIDNVPATLEATTTEQEITLQGGRVYVVSHDGEDSAGLSNSDTVYLSIRAAVDAGAGEGSDKIKLFPNRDVLIRGHGKLKFKTAAGTPTFLLAPSEYNPARN